MTRAAAPGRLPSTIIGRESIALRPRVPADQPRRPPGLLLAAFSVVPAGLTALYEYGRLSPELIAVSTLLQTVVMAAFWCVLYRVQRDTRHQPGWWRIGLDMLAAAVVQASTGVLFSVLAEAARPGPALLPDLLLRIGYWAAVYLLWTTGWSYAVRVVHFRRQVLDDAAWAEHELQLELLSAQIRRQVARAGLRALLIESIRPRLLAVTRALSEGFDDACLTGAGEEIAELSRLLLVPDGGSRSRSERVGVSKVLWRQVLDEPAPYPLRTFCIAHGALTLVVLTTVLPGVPLFLAAQAAAGAWTAVVLGVLLLLPRLVGRSSTVTVPRYCLLLVLATMINVSTLPQLHFWGGRGLDLLSAGLLVIQIAAAVIASVLVALCADGNVQAKRAGELQRAVVRVQAESAHDLQILTSRTHSGVQSRLSSVAMALRFYTDDLVVEGIEQAIVRQLRDAQVQLDELVDELDVQVD